jgi:glycerol uptake facilitator-like aquaporin
MKKYLSPLFSAAALMLLASSANAQGRFPCEAFQMQPNGMLAVVQSVTITGPSGQISMNPGMSFGPGVAMMGINVYDVYRQNCR